MEDYSKGIVTKTRDAVAGSARYQRQVLDFREREPFLREEDVTPLLLRPLDLRAFQQYREGVLPFLRTLIPRVLAR